LPRSPSFNLLSKILLTVDAVGLLRRFCMPRAFVLINVESGSEDEVLRELKKLEGVEEAYFSYGVYDLITRVKADTMENLKDMVSRRIRTLNKVRSTLTLIMMEE
jgi:DNA-binding Lrp family transcriptional regulator